MIKQFQTIVNDRELLDKIARLEEYRVNIDDQVHCTGVVDDRGDGDA